MLRIGICDDDEAFSLELEGYLLEYARSKEICIDTEIFVSAQKLFENLQEQGIFDILFLDIELEESSGIDIGKQIRSDLKNEAMQIVFVSAKEEYAMQLFDIRPMNFLVKPINDAKVAYILEEYSRLFSFQNRFFTYHIGKREYKVNEQSILYFQSEGKKIKMFFQDGIKEFYGKLSDVSEKLNEQTFCPVHKSYVINMRYVAEYTKDSIVMVTGETIPISQSMRKYVSRKILESEIGGMMDGNNRGSF